MLCLDVAVHTEMPFDGGDPFQKVIDLFSETGKIPGRFIDSVQVFANVSQLEFDVRQSVVDCVEASVNGIEASIRDVEALMHALEFIKYQSAESLEICLLRHIFALYHTATFPQYN